MLHHFVHRSRSTALLLAVLVVGLLLAPPAWAEGPEPKTAGDTAVDEGELGLRLLPLRKAQLEAEAEAWAGHLQAQIQAISDLQIQIAKAEGEAKEKLLGGLEPAQDARTALVDRVRIVLDAWDAKGGDSGELRTYLDQVTGIQFQITDASTAWTMIKNWVTSSDGGVKLGKGLLLFLVILFVARMVARIFSSLVGKALGRLKGTPRLLIKFLTNLVRNLLFFLGIVIALSVLGIDIGPLLALIGAAGLAIAFALQGTLSNFASGVMILLYRPFDVGDVVTAGGVTGKVDALTLVSTTIKTPDNQILLVPNSQIWDGVITNVTGSATRRVDMVFGIGYEDDIALAQKVLEEILEKHELVLAEPEPSVKLTELADSSVNFNVRPWVKTGDYWDVYWDVTRQVKERFDAEGISIPYPQQDVHVHQTAAS